MNSFQRIFTNGLDIKIMIIIFALRISIVIFLLTENYHAIPQIT
jgi:hypothetical protein